MKVVTALGELEINEGEVFNFEKGLLGFEKQKKWILRDSGETGIRWLVSIEDRNIAFLLLHVKDFFQDYSVRDFQLTSDHQVYSILTIRTNKDKQVVTANLLAPVILDTSRKTGLQFIQAGSEYSTVTLLFSGEESAC